MVKKRLNSANLQSITDQLIADEKKAEEEEVEYQKKRKEDFKKLLDSKALAVNFRSDGAKQKEKVGQTNKAEG
jgi:hypothetical protein